MWFGLIPGPFRVARAIDRTYSRSHVGKPRSSAYRRSVSRGPHPDTRSTIWWCSAVAAIVGAALALGNMPWARFPVGVSAPRGWLVHASGVVTPNVSEDIPIPPDIVGWITPDTVTGIWAGFISGLVITVGAVIAAIAMWCTRHNAGNYGGDDYYDPPWQPQPAPLPDLVPLRTRSGHKPIPVNRELPMDRPHPWRTWEG
jgi:hypothetical protein